MKNMLSLLLLFLTLVAGSQDQIYVFSFLENDRDTNKDLAVYISSTSEDKVTTGNIFLPLEDITIPFMIEPMAGTLINLPYQAEPSGPGFKRSTLFIQSDQHVYVYGYSSDYRSSDTFYALPETALGTDYYIVTPSAEYVNSHPTFSVTALYDDTSVLINFNQEVNGYNFTEITLTSLSTHIFKYGFDFSGTRVSSSKPISVLSGHECSYGSGDCDHIVEVMPPVESWGTKFVMTSFVGRATGYFAKIMAKDSGTVVKLLPQDEVHEIPLSGTIDIDISSAMIMESNHPILAVALVQADPFMSVIPAIEQSIPGPLPFYCFPPGSCYLNLWTSHDHHGVLLDDERVDWEVIMNSRSEGCLLRTNVSPGGHHVIRHVDPSAVFNGIVYGYDSYWSYGHTLPYKIAAPDIADTTPPKITLCHSSPIEVTGSQESNLTSVDWVEPSATDENGLPLLVTSNLLPGDLLPIGTTIVTYSFTDIYGNSDSCTFDVIVHDTTPPVPSCPGYIRIDGCSNRANVAWPTPSSWDNSEGNITVIEPTDQFSDSEIVEYTFTDSSGNTAKCRIDVEVNYKNSMCWDLNMPFIISTVIVGLTLLPLIFTLSVLLCGDRNQTTTKTDAKQLQAFQDRANMFSINQGAITNDEFDDIYEDAETVMGRSKGNREPGEDFDGDYVQPHDPPGKDFDTNYAEPDDPSTKDFATTYEEPNA